MIRIEIETNSAAFENGNEPYELARILRGLADRIASGDLPYAVRDINGNSVGRIDIVKQDNDDTV